MLHNIHLNELPPDGRFFKGEINTDVFGLTEEDDPRFVPPLQYDLNVKRDGADVVVEGSITVQFKLECARCGEWFLYEPALDEYFSQEPRNGAATLDLTEQMREDILLALPGYPRCEDSNVETRVCPEADRFASASDYIPLTEEETTELPERDVWGALDQITPLPEKSPSQS